jgi:hypothetical protein
VCNLTNRGAERAAIAHKEVFETSTLRKPPDVASMKHRSILAASVLC